MSVTLTLPEDVSRRLDAVVAQAGGRVEDLALDAILDRLEDLEDLAEAQRVLAEIKAGREEVMSLEALEQRYDMAH